ncbi:MAG: Mce-associated rane protein [Mycobacterium sp.]|nr:Mce-associated rane protein [Mycobacterium sp.]
MVSGGVRQDAPDTKLVPVNDEDTPNTAAEMRSLADRAEAEATEAEALAAAARARARAIRLRRQAERIDATKSAKKRPAAEEAVSEKEVSEDETAKPSDSDQAAVLDPLKVSLKKTKPAAAPEVTESADEPEYSEESLDDDDAEREASELSESSDDLDDEDTEQAASGRGRLWLSRSQWSAVATVLAVGVVLAATGASVEMIVDHRDAIRQRQNVAEFAAAARQGVVALTSLDFEHAKEGIQDILEVSTGRFKDDILKMAGDFTNVVEQSKVVSQGSVQATAVELDSITENSAVVLVASTSEVTNEAGAKQDPRKYRLIVTITRDDGQLKMSKVEFVS